MIPHVGTAYPTWQEGASFHPFCSFLALRNGVRGWHMYNCNLWLQVLPVYSGANLMRHVPHPDVLPPWHLHKCHAQNTQIPSCSQLSRLAHLHEEHCAIHSATKHCKFQDLVSLQSRCAHNFNHKSHLVASADRQSCLRPTITMTSSLKICSMSRTKWRSFLVAEAGLVCILNLGGGTMRRNLHTDQ